VLKGRVVQALLGRARSANCAPGSMVVSASHNLPPHAMHRPGTHSGAPRTVSGPAIGTLRGALGSAHDSNPLSGRMAASDVDPQAPLHGVEHVSAGFVAGGSTTLTH